MEKRILKEKGAYHNGAVRKELIVRARAYSQDKHASIAILATELVSVGAPHIA
jgi:hypothetical protein